MIQSIASIISFVLESYFYTPNIDREESGGTKSNKMLHATWKYDKVCKKCESRTNLFWRFSLTRILKYHIKFCNLNFL